MPDPDPALSDRMFDQNLFRARSIAERFTLPFTYCPNFFPLSCQIALDDQ